MSSKRTSGRSFEGALRCEQEGVPLTRGRALPGLLSGIEPFTQAVADKIKRQHRQRDHHSRENKEVRRHKPELARVVDHLTPRRNRLGDSQTQKAHTYFNKYHTNQT